MQEVLLYLVVKRLFEYGVNPWDWLRDAVNQGIKVSLLK